jgi:hypothetical protein
MVAMKRRIVGFSQAAHHLPLYQDKPVTPTSLKDIFTPIWSGPFQLELLSARASPQLREPDNLRTFVSSRLLGIDFRLVESGNGLHRRSDFLGKCCCIEITHSGNCAVKPS